METLTNRSMGQFLERGCVSPNCYTESVGVERLLSGSKQLSKRNNVDFKISNRLCVFKNKCLHMCFYAPNQARLETFAEVSKHVR